MLKKLGIPISKVLYSYKTINSLIYLLVPENQEIKLLNNMEQNLGDEILTKPIEEPEEQKFQVPPAEKYTEKEFLQVLEKAGLLDLLADQEKQKVTNGLEKQQLEIFYGADLISLKMLMDDFKAKRQKLNVPFVLEQIYSNAAIRHILDNMLRIDQARVEEIVEKNIIVQPSTSSCALKLGLDINYDTIEAYLGELYKNTILMKPDKAAIERELGNIYGLAPQQKEQIFEMAIKRIAQHLKVEVEEKSIQGIRQEVKSGTTIMPLVGMLERMFKVRTGDRTNKDYIYNSLLLCQHEITKETKTRD